MFGRVLYNSMIAVFVASLFVTTIAVGQTTCYVSPATKNALPSSTLTLGFYIANVTNLNGYNFLVVYDTTILRYDNAAVGSFFNSLLFFPRRRLDTLDMANVFIGGGVTSGSGMLFSVQFTAIGIGMSPMVIHSVDLRDANNNTIPSNINSGTVTIGNPPIVYIDPAYTPASAGGHDFGYDAFTTISSGVSAVQTNGTVSINNATYNETVTVAKDLTLTGVSNPTIQNLTINTPSVTIGGNIQVSGVLTLTSGVVTTGSNKITITNDQPGGVVITSGTIAGEICRTIAANNTGEYLFTNKFTKIKPDLTQPVTTVCVVAYPGTFPPSAPAGTAMNRYYTIETSPADFSAESLFLEFLPSENISSIPRTSWSAFKRVGTSPWQAVGSVPDLTGLNYFVMASFINSWSAWAIGNANNPLPIQLASFTGRVVNGRDVRLDWTTISEINNYGFEVQKSNGSAFVSIPNSFISGNGTTNIPHHYTFTETNAPRGNWHYRLKQIDLDGTEHFTEPIIVDVLTDVAEGSTPTQFKLEQNYPNPFNPTTTISFAVPKATHVTLEVFNTLGEKVATLLSQQMSSGKHRVEWNAEGAASGVYVVRMSSQEFVASQKMLLNK